MLKFSIMASNKKKRRPQHSRQTRTALSAEVSTLLAFAVPLAAALLIGSLTGSFNSGAGRAPVLAALGLASWFLGLTLFGMPSLGLRGGRPLFAGIGFATLGWVVFIILRAVLIPIDPQPTGSTRAFIYFFLFEAFALQLWAFGLLFRAVADWRGPLTATIAGGIVFSAAAILLFQNIVSSSPITLIYYIAWGIFYGIIRLRTGSLVGPVIIQALQSFTAWVALGGMPPETDVTQLHWVYGLSTIAYALFIWRLWPKEESDYRV